MSFFEKMWKEGWFNPSLDLDLDFEDVDIDRLKKDGTVVIQKRDRVYKVSIPREKNPEDLENGDVSIEELPGVATKSVGPIDSTIIYTSYFANWRNFPKDSPPVSIARFTPKGFNGRSYSALAPGVALLTNKKKQKIDESEYIRLFNLQLALLDPHAVAKELGGEILLCYEKRGEFCHRHLVADWLRNHGYPVTEL